MRTITIKFWSEKDAQKAVNKLIKVFPESVANLKNETLQFSWNYTHTAKQIIGIVLFAGITPMSWNEDK